MNRSAIEELTRSLLGALPQGVAELKSDLEKNFRAILQANFQKMNLVTREEFEIQTAVLARTRAKLEALEKQMGALEERLSKSGE